MKAWAFRQSIISRKMVRKLAAPCFLLAVLSSAVLLAIEDAGRLYSHLGALLATAIAVAAVAVYSLKQIVSQRLARLVDTLQTLPHFKLGDGAEKKDEIDMISLAIAEMQEALKRQAFHQKMAAIGMTTLRLAHDIRRPFSLLGATLNNLDPSHLTKQALGEAKATVVAAMHDVEKLAKDILDFSREEDLKSAPISVPALLRETFKTLNVSARRPTHILFKYDFKHTCRLWVDSAKLVSVIRNLFGNAVRLIETEPDNMRFDQKIWIHTRDFRQFGKPMIEMKIGNSGPPFSAEDLPKLFEPLALERKTGSLGLGLPLAKKIMHLHQGDIWAHNHNLAKPGYRVRGVEFTMTLPAFAAPEGEAEQNRADEERESTLLPRRIIDTFPKEPFPKELEAGPIVLPVMEQSIPEEPQVSTPTPSQPKGSDSVKILLLEDEDLYRRVLRQMIAKEVWLKEKVILYETDDVDQAIKLIKQENIPLAIVDIDLKRTKNGYDFLREIRGRVPPVHALMHTNRTMPEDKEKALALGATGFVGKPLGLSDLVRFITAYAGSALLLGKEQSLGFLETSENEDDRAEFADDRHDRKILSDGTCDPLLHLVIVDDDSAQCLYLQTLLHNILSDGGVTFEIKCFHSPEELLKNLANTAIDFIFSDNQFSASSDQTTMKGTDLLQLLQKEKPQARRFLYSNIAIDELAEVAKKSGSGYFSPDIDEEALREVLQSEGANQKSIRATLSSLFHDINKPALTMFTLLSAAKTQSRPKPFEFDESTRQEFHKIGALIERQKAALQSFALPIDIGSLADTAESIQERYLQQYAFITEFLNLDLETLQGNPKAADGAISVYKKMKKANNQFAVKMGERIAQSA